MWAFLWVSGVKENCFRGSENLSPYSVRTLVMENLQLAFAFTLLMLASSPSCSNPPSPPLDFIFTQPTNFQVLPKHVVVGERLQFIVQLPLWQVDLLRRPSEPASASTTSWAHCHPSQKRKPNNNIWVDLCAAIQTCCVQYIYYNVWMRA